MPQGGLLERKPCCSLRNHLVITYSGFRSQAQSLSSRRSMGEKHENCWLLFFYLLIICWLFVYFILFLGELQAVAEE